MPELNDISLHQLIAQWEKDLASYRADYERNPGAHYLEGRIDEQVSCIKELKQVIGLLP